jgi:hypothetical protein
MYRRGRRGQSAARMAAVFVAAGILLVAPAVSAESFQSSSYRIDSSTGNSFGGATSSTSYKLESSGGDAVIGDGSSGSYKIGQGYIPQLAQSIELQVQPSTVAAYYGFDENFGTKAYDDSVNSADATLNNTPTWTTGKLGIALSFNGSSQWISIPSTTENNIETVSVSAWIKTSQSPGSATPIIQKWDGSGGYPYALVLNTTGTVSFSASDGTNTPTVTSGATTVNDDAWHHVVGTRTDGGQMKIYVDGSIKNTTSDNASLSTTNSTVVGVARRSGGSNYFSGLIDEVKIFNAALSAQEVSNEYATGNDGFRSSYTFAALGTTSQTVGASMFVLTDAPSYTIGLNQNANLTNGGNSISPIGSNIASPALWTEGTTNGFGFTITSGPSIDSKWGSNPNYKYAAVPGSTTTILTRSGYGSGAKDLYAIQYRADVDASTAAGSYKNQVTYTATILP